MMELAAGRPASQSSDWSRAGYTSVIPAEGVRAASAVDSNSNQNITQEPYCAHTGSDLEPWWWVPRAGSSSCGVGA